MDIPQATLQKYNRSNAIEVMSVNKVPNNNNNNTSIGTELPEQIQKLITGSEFWVKAKTNRYLKLCREGHLNDLLKIAELAADKDNPANWFATTASKKMWKRTLDFLAKLKDVVKQAAQVAEKLGTAVTKFIYKQAWHNKYIQRWADLAAESGRSPIKYFAWLCKHGEETYGNQT